MLRLKRKLILLSSCMFLLSACSVAESSITYQERPDYKVAQPQNNPIIIESGAINQGKTPDNQKVTQITSSHVSKNVSSAEESKNAARRKVKVTEVIDGDTIKFFDPALGTVVTARLLGINGPEYTKEVQYLGKERALNF